MLTKHLVIERLNAASQEGRRRSNAGIVREGPAAPGTPPPEINPWHPEDVPLRPAAVLVPLVNHGDGLTVVLTRRTDHLSTHAGQISFPGGRMDDDDDGPVHTALRETEEEIGIAPHRIEVVGHLDQYIVGSGFLVSPVVGFIEPPVEVAPHDHEVAEVFEVPLDFLIDPANVARHHREFEGRIRHFYAITYLDYYIWGATAGMLRDLAGRLTDGLIGNLKDDVAER